MPTLRIRIGTRSLSHNQLPLTDNISRDHISKIDRSTDTKASKSKAKMSQGILVTAGKVHTPFKTELLNTIGGERFAARPPHLVGILATKKEDARTYAEVCKADRPIYSPQHPKSRELGREANKSSPRKHASKLESISSLGSLAKLGLGWMVRA
jgi:hypothetical protein